MLHMNFFKDVAGLYRIPMHHFTISDQVIPYLFPEQKDIKLRYKLLLSNKKCVNISTKIYTQFIEIILPNVLNAINWTHFTL